MNWEQKLDALNSIAECQLLMRKPGDWYVLQRAEIGGDGCLSGRYGNGATPEEAVEAHWMRLVTELDPKLYIVTKSFTDQRKHWRWNGFMWRELPIEKKP